MNPPPYDCFLNLVVPSVLFAARHPIVKGHVAIKEQTCGFLTVTAMRIGHVEDSCHLEEEEEMTPTRGSYVSSTWHDAIAMLDLSPRYSANLILVPIQKLN